MNNFWGFACFMLNFARNAPNFDDLPKTGNYTTPEEIALNF